jgi:ubiquinone/menaquinone biosynthesis C-methylase UbiE
MQNRRPAPRRPHKGPAKRPSAPREKKGTTWGHVASWYNEHITEGDTYHEHVVKPNLLDALGDVRGKEVLDVACGQGFFSRLLHEAGARVTGIDIAPSLIRLAKEAGPADIRYGVVPADKMDVSEASFDIAICVLALQNIRNLAGTLGQIAKALKPGGEFVFVLNHPAFRVPRRSSWGFDADTNTQFRRVDGYLSESEHKIQMHPGADKSVTTISYHRPLQSYVEGLAHHGFSIVGLEEWISHRKSEKGPREQAENRARKEFPLFLMVKTRKSR